MTCRTKRRSPRSSAPRRYSTMRIYNIEYRFKNKSGQTIGVQDDKTIIARNQDEAKKKLQFMIRRPIKIDSVTRWFDDVNVKDIRGIPRN
jgi:hypothetical protein